MRRSELALVMENEEAEVNALFVRIRDKLDSHYDRRERLVKISRDITALAKKMIFSLHRLQGNAKTVPPGIKREIDQREAEIQKLLKMALPDLQGANAYRYVLLLRRY